MTQSPTIPHGPRFCQRDNMAISPWKARDGGHHLAHPSSAPVHATNPFDAFGRQHLKAMIGKIDALEDANADGMTRLIQES
jgi:hypothetical protein